MDENSQLEGLAEDEDLRDNIAYAESVVEPDDRTLEECIADEYEEGVF